MHRKVAFGRRLKTLRKNLGYSQEVLAEIAGLHRTYVGGVERGERNISLTNIWRIADALGVPPSELFVSPVPSEKGGSRFGGRAATRRSAKDPQWAMQKKR
jgi:transcriptional regulator with XRE-family HTH domain